MTLTETALDFAALARAKSEILKDNRPGFLVAAAMAGAYVGIGILLIFSVGETVPASVRPMVMGCSFGIALTLVVFAGAELFTGHAMYMTLGVLAGTVPLRDLAGTWVATWIGNLAGCVALAALFVIAGSAILADGASLLNAVAAKKMAMPASELVARGILCNWLVCLAIWCAARTANDAAKCILIFWCLYAFIACGFEHSIANMTVFSVALLSDHPDNVTLVGAARNLVWVTLGNTISGAGFMGLGYWLASGRPRVGRHKSQPLAAES